MSNSASPIPDLHADLSLRTSLFWSLYGVWYRHFRVYTKTFLANATPPVLEPVFFFTAVAIGLGAHMSNANFEGLSYAAFVASGIVVSSAMFSAVFETTFGTFVRLVFQKTYDAMLGTHLRISEMFVGEILFAATKGGFFAAVVLAIVIAFGVRPSPWAVLVPLVGVATAYLFAAIGLVVTSYVKMINNFAFFHSGVITPLFFFSGTFFPIRGHYAALDVIASALPLTPCIELSRALFRGEFTPATAMYAGILAAYIVAAHVFALRRMTQRVLGGGGP
jgi:lipooligosaccharide transport system permease protein